MDIKIFQKNSNDSFTLHHDTITETTFPIEDIKDAVVKHFIIEAVENHKGLKKGEPAGALSSFVENKTNHNAHNTVITR